MQSAVLCLYCLQSVELILTIKNILICESSMTKMKTIPKDSSISTTSRHFRTSVNVNLDVYGILLSGQQTKHGSRHCFHQNLQNYSNYFPTVKKHVERHTSPTEVARRLTIFSCGTATTLWLFISIILCPTLTPPLSAIPPLSKLQICNKYIGKITKKINHNPLN